MIYYDFGFYLSVAAIITGVITLIDKLKWRKEREAEGIEYDEKGNEVMPFHIDIARSFFPIIFVILILRSFIYEPYRIPSGSMNPGLYDGDFILVNKFAYGIRLPAFNTKLISIGDPQRGDVIVFHPPNPRKPGENIQDAYIKRLIGMPGDRLEWNGDTLTIFPKCSNRDSCEPMVIKSEHKSSTVEDLVPDSSLFDTFSQTINGKTSDLIYYSKDIPLEDFNRAPSLYQRWTRVIPEGKYFGMGDHRDGSSDSRAWGFIDEDAFIGRAAAKWLFMEFTDEPVFTLPLFNKPIYLPTGISFDRVGAIK